MDLKKEIIKQNIHQILSESDDVNLATKKIVSMFIDKFLFVEKEDFNLNVLSDYRNFRLHQIKECFDNSRYVGDENLINGYSSMLDTYLQAETNALFHYLIMDMNKAILSGNVEQTLFLDEITPEELQ
ncbi:hypothetical protein [Lysinibacillus fusiformis]|uniref:hypothetical protein n=1 Tax=Lysinibacillus fusiformis TaxID=28031 RepID=UPI0004688437|nr:hypothetical protein [Lysinibacillus fusiformis]